MYVYKFVITYSNGHVRNEWICSESGESTADLKCRADIIVYVALGLGVGRLVLGYP